MKTFEYKIEPIDYGGNNAFITNLNRLGSEGWELVTITPTNYCLFKRELTAGILPL